MYVKKIENGIFERPLLGGNLRVNLKARIIFILISGLDSDFHFQYLLRYHIYEGK